MSHVHGDRIDRSRSVVLTRWWGLGILSLARLTARGVLDLLTGPGSPRAWGPVVFEEYVRRSFRRALGKSRALRLEFCPV